MTWGDATGLGKLKLVYGGVALVFLAVLAFSPVKDLFQEWRDYQLAYNDFVRQQPVKIKTVPVKLRQLWVRELDTVDRCVSCHVGLREKGLSDAPQPFTAHPRIPHEVEDFGCTTCHEGQGRATTMAAAHGPVRFWDDPMLATSHVEAGCGACHQEKQPPAAPVLSAGRRLIEELNCVGCHDLPGYEKSFTPNLNGIGEKVNRPWLVRWLTDPSEIDPATRMPDFQLSSDETELLADFLMSFRRFPANAQLQPLPEDYESRWESEEFIELGKTRFREARCISCHSVEGKGGHLAPDLGKVASKLSPMWLFNFLGDPGRFQPGVPMPRYGLSDTDRAAVTAYMMNEFIDWDAPEEHVTSTHQPHPNFYEEGLALFNQYNCAGCHTLDESRVSQNRGPSLAAIGSKQVFELDFGTLQLERTREAFVEAKLSNPRGFRETLRMPQLHLDPEEIQAITTALLAQRDEHAPPEMMRTDPPVPAFEPHGAIGRVFDRYSCLTCHTVRGTGGDIAPDLTRVGSQLQRTWVERYFEVPFSRRPIQAERMPNLFMTDDEIRTVTDFFYSMLLDDSLQVDGIPIGNAEAVEFGRSMFWDTYGCHSCHQVGAKGGYVGPPLDGAGKRLQPGWIVSWLQDPQSFDPNTLEPRTGMSLDESKAIAAYLMSLRAEP